MADRVVPPMVIEAWEQQRTWSRTANHLKQHLDRARTAVLVLAVAAAVLAVGATQLTPHAPGLGRLLGAGAGLSAGLGTVLQRRLGTQHIRAWTRARSAAEGLKSEVYSYLAGGSAYSEGEDREQTLSDRAQRILDGVSDLQRHTLGTSSDHRSLPAVTGLEDYITARVDAQIDGFYRPRAARYERRVRRLRWLESSLGVAAVVLSALATAYDDAGLTAWVPVATTAGTSVATHIAVARYDHLVMEYLCTARRLQHLRDTHRRRPGPETAFIDACESAITAENQAWMARWGTEEPRGTSGSR